MLFIFLLYFCGVVQSIGEDDRVLNLPGLEFKIDYNLYSGYLNANENGTWKMHYWLIESKSNKDTAPVLVWFQGGPGCSSFGGSFEENGPFYINWDGETLFENKFAWNMQANVLFLESPIGVGFSYDTTNPNFSNANDDQSAGQNYQALRDFFTRVQPKFNNRTFFLSGESYAGVYIPMLSAKLTEGINNGTFPNKNFQGAAIGNGFMSTKDLYNALVLWSVYHGKVSLNDWDQIKQKCSNGAAHPYDVDTYNFFQFLNSTNKMDYYSDHSECGDLVYKAIQIPDEMDPYNYYQDCWNPAFLASDTVQLRKLKHMIKEEGPIAHPANKHRVKRNVNMNPHVNTASLWNYDSPDNQLGYPCWNGNVMRKYVRRADVQKALHIDEAWQNATNTNETRRRWEMCNDEMYANYVVTYPDQQKFFDYVLENNQNLNFRFLIYNGDVDTVCNYLGDSWFIRRVAGSNNFKMDNPRNRWWYSGQTAGFVQRYSRTKDTKIIDVLTVKGAGHMVPNDRPSLAYQMIFNFLHPKAGLQPDYNSALDNPTLATFLNPVQPSPKGNDNSSALLHQSLLFIFAVFHIARLVL